MSASSRLIRRATAQPILHSRVAQRAVRNGSSLTMSRASLLYRSMGNDRALPAVAILLGRRNISTETTSHSTGAGGPPPGFDPKKAQQPLPQEPKKTPSKSAQEGDKAAKADDKDSLTALAARKADSEAVEKKDEKKPEKKMTLGQKIKHEIQHYWDGTKLLATEVRISMRLAIKMAAGYELTRRENRQLQRTVQDLGRLVPFSVFVIVPFAELLLPVALKLFPNLLPSTYEAQSSKDLKSKNLRATRKEVSSFLRNTLKETGLPFSQATLQKEAFTEFFRKVRATGESPTHADIIKVCKLFKDDLTLDNLSRPQLVGMCRYMNLSTIGTDTLLRYHVRHRMRQIKRDDKAIAYEGVGSLSVTELQTAAAARGIRTYGVSPGRLRDDLQTWLDLRLRDGVPSTLLVLSNAFMYSQGKETEIDSQMEALSAVLSSIPEELFHEIELEVHTAEGAATNKQRLEVLKEQQELIEEENEQNEESKSTGSSSASVKDDQNIDDNEQQQQHQLQPETSEKPDEQVKEMRESEADAIQESQTPAAIVETTSKESKDSESKK